MLLSISPYEIIFPLLCLSHPIKMHDKGPHRSPLWNTPLSIKETFALSNNLLKFAFLWGKKDILEPLQVCDKGSNSKPNILFS